MSDLHRLQLMLFTLLGNRGRPVSDLSDGLRELWDHPALRAELAELLGVLEDRSRTPTYRYELGQMCVWCTLPFDGVVCA